MIAVYSLHGLDALLNLLWEYWYFSEIILITPLTSPAPILVI